MVFTFAGDSTTTNDRFATLLSYSKSGGASAAPPRHPPPVTRCAVASRPSDPNPGERPPLHPDTPHRSPGAPSHRALRIPTRASVRRSTPTPPTGHPVRRRIAPFGSQPGGASAAPPRHPPPVTRCAVASRPSDPNPGERPPLHPDTPHRSPGAPSHRALRIPTRGSVHRSTRHVTLGSAAQRPHEPLALELAHAALQLEPEQERGGLARADARLLDDVVHRDGVVTDQR